MQSKVWVGVLSFAGLALVTFAQDDGTEAAANKAVTTQTAPASSDADPNNEANTGSAKAALDDIADAVIDSVDDAAPEAPDLTAEATPSSAVADDIYKPTERISGDRSVKFPVDI